MKKLLLLLAIMASSQISLAAGKYDNPDTIVVARDGTGQFRTIDEAIETLRFVVRMPKKPLSPTTIMLTSPVPKQESLWARSAHTL